MKILGWIAASLILLAIIFLCVDCCAGRTRYLECSVLDHRYTGAWTELRMETTIDSDGHTSTSTSTVYHPEEFDLFCLEYGKTAPFWVSSYRQQYDAIANGQDVNVCIREGRWTKGHYLARIN